MSLRESSREKERQCPWIAARAVLAKFPVYRRGFVLTASCAQRLSERPLIFGKRIQLRSDLQNLHGFAKLALTKQDSTLQE